MAAPGFLIALRSEILVKVRSSTASPTLLGSSARKMPLITPRLAAHGLRGRSWLSTMRMTQKNLRTRWRPQDQSQSQSDDNQDVDDVPSDETDRALMELPPLDNVQKRTLSAKEPSRLAVARIRGRNSRRKEGQDWSVGRPHQDSPFRFGAEEQYSYCQNGLVEQPVVNSPNDALAAAAALVEIERLVHVLHELVNGPDRMEMTHRAHAYVSEATWWIASLDRQFREANLGGAYSAARGAHNCGRLIPGILWMRDRISHQLPFTVMRNGHSFLDPKSGTVLLSSGYEWLPAEQIRPGVQRLAWEAIYREDFVGHGIVEGPDRIRYFLRALLEKDPTCRMELERIAFMESSGRARFSRWPRVPTS
jgi:hypothetical protein